ncbi:Uncharacterized protein Fot_42557 [Forsythia ovata]|uniref:Uncharacterized protein n=1 Tax=Forsythia ovata TaxID=205694 RepID=A0ABD1RLJ4_9LAMI
MGLLLRQAARLFHGCYMLQRNNAGCDATAVVRLVCSCGAGKGRSSSTGWDAATVSMAKKVKGSNAMMVVGARTENATTVAMKEISLVVALNLLSNSSSRKNFVSGNDIIAYSSID